MHTPTASKPTPIRWTRQVLATSLALALIPLAHAHEAAAKPAHGTAHAGAHTTGHAAPTTDAEAIRAVLMETWDQAHARLVVDPVVVRGGIALAGWQQGDRGGRALLRQRGKGWIVAICAGDDLKDAALLRDVGLPAADADALARQLAHAESTLDPKVLARFASFDGLVRMDEQGNHPPGHGAGGHEGHGTGHGGHTETPGGGHAQHQH